MLNECRPVAVDLFAGAGGLSLGLRSAGFDVRAAVEHDPTAARTYRANLGDHVLEEDLHSYKVEHLLKYANLEVGACDLLAGGPPCQGFSVQRRGSDDDPRNSLVLHFARFIEGLRPKMFLMENVSGLMSSRGRPFLNELLSKVATLGYSVFIEKLDAVRYGVPQFRTRVILAGQRNDLGLPAFRFPPPTHNASSYVTVRDAIADLPSPPVDGTPHPTVHNHSREARLSKLNLERLAHIPEGGDRRDLPPHLQLPCHVNNPSHRHVEVYGRLEWDRPAGTITARFDSFTRGRFAHPVENRSLTLREGARLQMFPDSFAFSGSREEVARQIGNAVPVRLAHALGASIRGCLAGHAATVELVAVGGQLALEV